MVEDDTFQTLHYNRCQSNRLNKKEFCFFEQDRLQRFSKKQKYSDFFQRPREQYDKRSLHSSTEHTSSSVCLTSHDNLIDVTDVLCILVQSTRLRLFS